MTRDPSLPPEDLPLAEASVQEIQLELIRRNRFNQCDGRKVVASLRAHRKLWRAVIMDRIDVGETALIKLRDLKDNYWNVDRLFILCHSLEDAYLLVRIAEQEEWEADSIDVFESFERRSRALGTSEPGYIVSMWWD